MNTTFTFHNITVSLTENEVDDILTAAVNLAIAYYTADNLASIGEEANALIEVIECANIVRLD